MDKREFIARRIAQELKDGDVVNLGVGVPTMVADYVPAGIDVVFQSENGIVGMGPTPEAGQEDKDMVNAGAQPTTILPGGALCDSSFSFGIIRGGRVDKSILGGLQVDEEGNLANWIIPGHMIPGMGGAMDLVVGAKKVIIAMEHVTRKGEPKILKKCVFPLTACKEVDLVVTDMAVIEVGAKGLILREVAPGLTAEDVQKATEAKLEILGDVKTMTV